MLLQLAEGLQLLAPPLPARVEEDPRIVIGLLVMVGKALWVNKQDAGDANMKELAGYIARGASAFLKAEWKVLGVFAAIALTFVVTYFLLNGAEVVKRALKQTGIALLERVFGLLLAALAVQFVADGAKDLWKAG